MAQLCYITTCKGRLAHLQQSLPRVVDQPGIECVVVDYDCPEGSGDWVRGAFPQVRVVQVSNAPGFCAARARNLGAQQATAPWLGFFDADILLDGAFAARLLPALAPGNFYRASPVTLQSWGSLVCHSDDFRRVGGYDEAYAGWGGEDDDLIAMLRHHGVRPLGFAAALLGEIAHSEAQRTRYYAIKNRWTQARINQLYLHVKLDLLRLRGGPLAPSDAAALYGEIARTASGAERGGQAGYYVDVTLPPSVIGTPPQDGLVETAELQRTLRYALTLGPRRPDPGVIEGAPPCI